MFQLKWISFEILVSAIGIKSREIWFKAKKIIDIRLTYFFLRKYKNFLSDIFYLKVSKQFSLK